MANDNTVNNDNTIDTDAWAVTDVYGEVQSCSRAARALLGLSHRGRHSLLVLFADYCKALVFDIEVALTGWPTRRTVAIRRASAPNAVVRYQVSRRVDTDHLQLFWEFTVEQRADLPRSA